MAEHSAVTALRAAADLVLKSDAALSELYELKGALSGAQSGCVQAIELRTGVAFALCQWDLAALHPAKCEELASAIAAQPGGPEPWRPSSAGATTI